VAGGTGLAVVPSLAAMLHERGKRVELYYGVSEAQEASALEALGLGAPGLERLPSLCVPDSGQPGRVLEVLAEELRGQGPDPGRAASFYNIGPHPFIDRAMRIEESLGASPENIFAGLETLTMCGVGLCGGCECGGRLLCKEGTFVSLRWLRAAGVELSELDEAKGGGDFRPKAHADAALPPLRSTSS
jgi:dihydroorotate dehydrogenase (NAD+) catalytic subunit